ncbi:MAG: hypothetical protein KJ607_02675 [Bacteroidetes bacterium]|nr:hypothetical protein [Bacteroidota bacterium]
MWGDAGAECSRAIATDGDSVIYVGGKTTSYGAGDNDMFLLKYDSAGTLLGWQVWGGYAYEVAQDIVVSGDYAYLTGITGSFGTQNTQNDALLR